MVDAALHDGTGRAAVGLRGLRPPPAPRPALRRRRRARPRGRRDHRASVSTTTRSPTSTDATSCARRRSTTSPTTASPAGVEAYREGEVYLPGSPVLTVRAPFAEAVLLETVVLSILNHDSAVASAAARMVGAAGDRPLLEFGGRRTHEWAGAGGGAGRLPRRVRRDLEPRGGAHAWHADPRARAPTPTPSSTTTSAPRSRVSWPPFGPDHDAAGRHLRHRGGHPHRHRGRRPRARRRSASTRATSPSRQAGPDDARRGRAARGRASSSSGDLDEHRLAELAGTRRSTRTASAPPSSPARGIRPPGSSTRSSPAPRHPTPSAPLEPVAKPAGRRRPSGDARGRCGCMRDGTAVAETVGPWESLLAIASRARRCEAGRCRSRSSSTARRCTGPALDDIRPHHRAAVAELPPRRST